MASFALVLTLCIAAKCNSYQIDGPLPKEECVSALVVESDYLARIWGDDSRVAGYVAPFAVQEAVGQLTDYDYTCEPLLPPTWVAPPKGSTVVFK